MGKKTFLDVIAKQVVDIRKIALHYHKTLTLGYVPPTLMFKVNVRYELL